MTNNYTCNHCGWKGIEKELDYDTTDTCFGDDKIEICPSCGSMEVYVVVISKNGNQKA